MFKWAAGKKSLDVKRGGLSWREKKNILILKIMILDEITKE